MEEGREGWFSLGPVTRLQYKQIETANRHQAEKPESSSRFQHHQLKLVLEGLPKYRPLGNTSTFTVQLQRWLLKRELVVNLFLEYKSYFINFTNLVICKLEIFFNVVKTSTHKIQN